MSRPAGSAARRSAAFTITAARYRFRLADTAETDAVSAPISDAEIAAEFDAYLKSLKWQLIQTRIFKDNNIQLTNQEVMEFTKGLLVGNYAQYGLPAPDDQELTETAARLLQNKEQANGIYDRLAEAKLTAFFKSTVSLTKKELAYDDFVAMAQA